ncbi:hypothetical protein [Kitasatospora purpeofusca]|uniref:hypothetical protein n=1 Tax=Kitasatospora purpeofusca TaxID=67352 RepID=UPI002257A13F|nr:hypothetical protein [Kitasatospora purpeofusca]MCX4756802.1 hypothetical protein [Kitasatospora purpeofusca]WSR35418.1 hypothetical protein OG715_33320 [Kitasatospora purpeofusca]WSR43738.1 hypothetical protein OG196_34360 [Kitasatospora purpeofusca]
MITYEEHRLRSLVDEGRWIELLGAYRQARAAAVALDLADGDPVDGDLTGSDPAYRRRTAATATAVSAAQSRAGIATAALGHLIAYAAPPEVAARLFDADGGPGTAAGVADHDAGPLWEVLATRHTWRRLAPLLGPPPVRRLVAQTRVLLGEDLSRGAEPDPEGVPLLLEPWESVGRAEGMPVREYLRQGGSRSALLTLPASREGLARVELPEPGVRLPGQPATRALAELAGWARTVCVRGPAAGAAAQLVPGPLVIGGYLPFALAWPALVQAGIADRAHGAAHGRLALWRVLTAMTGAQRPEAADRAEVRALVARMRCFTWDDPADRLRHLHLALEDPATGLSWAVSGSEEV